MVSKSKGLFNRILETEAPSRHIHRLLAVHRIFRPIMCLVPDDGTRVFQLRMRGDFAPSREINPKKNAVTRLGGEFLGKETRGFSIIMMVLLATLWSVVSGHDVENHQWRWARGA
ncbi:hypothetical protein EMCG_01365 [[Emmonsia] crescens]|uniref:Uncharacterized protein n=1 Tax=[Emmonsia] crescens TaxID=73230 RepID=A0A0G2I251_9EURO|nr:hypothetical protein EMCG_01365 [Emmonsia crescens UAMH 3008]